MNGYMQVAGCKNGNCPKVYRDGDRIFVQGGVTREFTTPEGEAVVEIPLGVLEEAAKEVLA